MTEIVLETVWDASGNVAGRRIFDTSRSRNPLVPYGTVGQDIEGKQPVMESDDQFAQWAALFSSSYGESKTGTGLPGMSVPPASGIPYIGVSPAACELLRAIDAGGVPTFVTSNLKQIAEDNGIEVTSQSTPNAIVEAIRAKASVDSSGCMPPSD